MTSEFHRVPIDPSLFDMDREDMMTHREPDEQEQWEHSHDDNCMACGGPCTDKDEFDDEQ